MGCMASGMIIAGFFIRACMSVLRSNIQAGLRASVYPRHDLLQGRKELLPPALGALVGLLLIRPKARLLHAQVGPRARRGEGPSDDTLETIRRPRVRQRFVLLDCQDLTVDSAPVCAKIATVVHDGLEIVLHQPLLDQVWLRERAPDLFRRKSYLPFDNDGERFGRSIVHWSILLSRSSRWSNRLLKPPTFPAPQSLCGLFSARIEPAGARI